MTETMETESGEQIEQPRTNQIARRGFDSVSLASENAATQALIAKATADIQARWVMALRRPRNLDDVRQDLIQECKRPGFARVAMYHVPRGGGQVHGLSIRFAEVAARCMGNMSIESQTLFDSKTERVVRVSVTDFETNVAWWKDVTVAKTVERKKLGKGQRPISQRVNSYGDPVYIVEATDDDVATKEAALISKAARTLILRLIPGHLQDEMRGIITKTAQDEAAKDPNAARNRALDAFGELGIAPSEVLDYLGKPFEQATKDDWIELSQLMQALRERETTWAEALAGALERREKRNGSHGKAPEAGAPTPAPASDKPAPAKKPQGAAAVKNQIQQGQPKTSPPPATTTPPKTEPKPEPAAAATPPPAKTEPPAAIPRADDDDDAAPFPFDDSADDVEERACAKCGVPIDVPKGSPQGAQCYACRNS